MFLVNDDKAQLRQRREHRQARSQHNARGPRLRGNPVIEPFAFGETAVQADHVRVRETAAHRGLQLRRQRNFRHQQQRLPAGLEHLVHHAQIDFGLAAARHTEQQMRLERRQLGAQRGHGSGLIRCERRADDFRVYADGCAGRVRQRAVVLCHITRFHQLS